MHEHSSFPDVPGIVEIDTDGKITFCNESWTRLIGYSKKECFGKSIWELSPPDTAIQIRNDIGEILRDGFSSRRYPYVAVLETRDGTAVKVFADWDLRRDEAGLVTGIVSSVVKTGDQKPSEGAVAGPAGTDYGARPGVSGEMQAEEATMNSERSLQAILAASPIGIGRLRNRVIEWVNESLCGISGCTPEEFIGKNTRTFYSSDEEYERIGKVLYGEGQAEARFVKKDGKTIDVHMQVAPTDSYSYIFTVSDVTRQKRAESALRFTQFAVDNAREGILFIGSRGEIIYANEAFCIENGYGAEEISSMTLFDINPDITPENWPTRMHSARESLTSFVEEKRHRRKDGSIYPVEVSSAYFCYDGKEFLCVIIRNVAKRKEVEEALIESEEKYRKVVENSLSGFYIIQNNLFRFVNKRFCEIQGYSRDEIVDKMGPLDNVLAEDRPRVRENIEKRSAGKANQSEYEFRIMRKDGSIVFVRAIGSPIIYRGRKALTGMLMDITRERTLESQLQQAQKMEALGALAGGVAHDFNNILTALIGYSRLLDLKMSDEDPLKVYVKQIMSSSGKAANLTHNLLAFSRDQAVELKPVGIGCIITGVKRLLKQLLTEDIELKILQPETDVVIMGDISRMDQVFLNLAANARDAMPAGGELTIEVETTKLKEGAVQRRSCAGNGTYALIRVTDTGVGMDDNTVKRIFEPFFTTKKAGKGTGLGLSIVYGIVKEHGGYIEARSEPGKGTTFHIHIPAAEPVAVEEDAVTPAARGGMETILVAEDDEEVRELTVEILAGMGYTVLQAMDGIDAITQFRNHKDTVALIILDVVMPHKNGKDVYEEIYKIKPGIKAIFTSGYTVDVVMGKGIAETDCEFIQKPIPPDALLRKVRDVLDN